jgi:hypothetical protein
LRHLKNRALGWISGILIVETGFRGRFGMMSAPSALTASFLIKRPFDETPKICFVNHSVTP